MGIPRFVCYSSYQTASGNAARWEGQGVGHRSIASISNILVTVTGWICEEKGTHPKHSTLPSARPQKCQGVGVYLATPLDCLFSPILNSLFFLEVGPQGPISWRVPLRVRPSYFDQF